MKLSITFSLRAATLQNKVFILLISFLPLAGFAQEADSTGITVVYDPSPVKHNLLFMINGKPIPSIFIHSIAPNAIQSLDISKTDTVVNGHTYDGTIRMTMKPEYSPDFISLTEVKKKYTALANGPTVYMIDDHFINSDPDLLAIDQNHILKIEVSTLNNTGGAQGINVVKLLTKSAENIKKSKQIWLRGGTFEPAANYN